MNCFNYFKNYGFLFVILFTSGVLTPDFSQKVSLLELDLVAMANTKSGSNFIKQSFWLFLFLVYFLLLIQNFRDVKYIKIMRNINVPIGVLVFLFFISILSAIWSELQVLSLKRSLFQGILYFVLLQSLVFALINKTLLDSVSFVIGSVILLSLFSVIFSAGINPYNEFSGFAKNKNEMGTIISFAFILTCVVSDKYGVFYKFKLRLVILYVMLLFTQSMTCIFTVTMFSALFITCKDRNIVKFILSIMTVFLVVFFILIPVIVYSSDGYWHPGLVFEPGFLTGRGLIWDNIYHELFVFNKVFLGYGFGSYFGTGLTPFYFDDMYSFLRYINSSHNGYIELFTQFGFFSAPICLVLFFSIISKASVKMGLAMIFPIIHNITEPSIMRDQHIIWVMTICILVASYIDECDPEKRIAENRREL